MEAQHGALLVVDDVGVVGGEQERRHRPCRTRRRLDDVRDVALVGRLVEVVEPLTGVCGVGVEVEVGALGDALQLVPAPRKQELDVGGTGRVVRQLVGAVRPRAAACSDGDAETHVPVEALVAPVLVPLRAVARRDEELHLHLLELAGAEDPVLRCDLVAEALAHLGDAERRLLAGGLQHVDEVGEHALRRLRSQVRHGAGVLDRAGVGLEHQVELAGLGERLRRPAVGAGVGIVELVEAEALLAVGAVDERVAEAGEVTARLPDRRRAEDRRVDQHDVVALLHHRPHPGVLHVAQQQRAERAVVVRAAEAAVDLGRRDTRTRGACTG